ncbi:MAG: type 4a pilus biogenesis protein PilO [Planctomycetes bacterium]|nr:type 4a pilus biogenesis protein PilO [Planctomycetota bacterium]
MRFLARHDTLIAIIGTAILTAGYYWGIVRPSLDAAQSIKSEIAESQAKMGEVPVILAERTQLQLQLERKQSQLKEMELVLPTESHVAEVLHQVASQAQHSGLMITRLEPLPSVDYASYSAHPFHLTCRGEFNDVARFLKGLESQPRLVTFGNVDLTRNAESQGPEVTQPLIQANLHFSVYSRATDL